MDSMVSYLQMKHRRNFFSSLVQIFINEIKVDLSSKSIKLQISIKSGYIWFP